jgi:nucleotide-binding universal stress UspA family protein
MMHRIMVPTDGLALSARAIPVAEEFARTQGAELVLVRVVDQPDALSWGLEAYLTQDVHEELAESLRIAAEQDLAAMAQDIGTRGVVARPLAVIAKPATGLLDTAMKLRPNLVVMTSHGRSGLPRFALGSVAERLVRDGTAPVLVVHESTPVDGAIELALVPLDGSRRDAVALAMVESLAGAPLRGVRLLRVLAERERGPAVYEYLRHAASRLRARGLVVTAEVHAGDPAQAIREAAEQVNLVVIATHGRSGLDRMWHGSVAEAVTRQIQTPVLLVRAASELSAVAPTDAPALLVAAGAA